MCIILSSEAKLRPRRLLQLFFFFFFGLNANERAILQPIFSERQEGYKSPRIENIIF